MHEAGRVNLDKPIEATVSVIKSFRVNTKKKKQKKTLTAKFRALLVTLLHGDISFHFYQWYRFQDVKHEIPRCPFFSVEISVSEAVTRMWSVKKCSWKFPKIDRKTLVPQPDF